jgi:predicted extracellular nuclease
VHANVCTKYSHRALIHHTLCKAVVTNTQTIRGIAAITANCCCNYRFIIQDIDGDANAATSDGIFVKLIDSISMPAIGDTLYVTGTVSEFFNLTRIDSVTQVHNTPYQPQ